MQGYLKGTPRDARAHSLCARASSLYESLDFLTLLTRGKDPRFSKEA
nr:MAG TPA: hypothetical protein [Caudoviricetes sp.]